ncbi:hypothetical protein BG015_010714 [Linnemannia schmuckeri]|uniref:F-box domain-containing protein n=1 Tax=Linnemannia schmuckeri TaxID=64567 RepID=A0A9P5RWE0_9FUNG|nr:hypothetical protein BG015_010714 [Linnemannia schmuckeri]
MDPLSRLPLECLQRILQILADKKNLAQLATLLRVNRYISLVTLPFLYRDPFKAVRDVYRGSKRSRALLRTLLSSTSVTNLHPALLFEFELNATSPEFDLPRLDYTHIMRNVDITPYQFRDCMQEGTSKSRIKETDYILERLDRIPPDYIDNSQGKKFLTWCCHQDIVFKELVWTFVSPILEQLETLSIPLSDITRYHQEIDRLPRLEHVHFILDVIYANTQGDELTKHMSQDNAMRAIVHFVEEHTRVFKGRLKGAKGASSETGIYLGNTITKEAQQQIYRLLPPIQQLQSISNNNWDHLLAHPLTTDLTDVEVIWGVKPEQWQHAAREGLQILPRCRSLKRLDTLALGKGAFAWAVQEKKRLTNFGSGSSGGSDGGQGSFSLDDNNATSAIRQVTLPPWSTS